MTFITNKSHNKFQLSAVSYSHLQWTHFGTVMSIHSAHRLVTNWNCHWKTTNWIYQFWMFGCTSFWIYQFWMFGCTSFWVYQFWMFGCTSFWICVYCQHHTGYHNNIFTIYLLSKKLNLNSKYILCISVKVKQSHYSPGQAQRVPGGWVPRFNYIRHMKVVRLSALHTGRLNPPVNIPGTYLC
jgi:hypothetical protein